MQNNKKFTRNVLLITFTNLIRFLANAAATLIVPLLLDKANYGYYKTFTLYLTYFGIFNLGLIDGIYLKFGGVDYQDLDKSKFRAYTRFLLYLELIVSIIIFLVSFLSIKGDTKYVFMFLGINMLSVQFTTYFQRISQITTRFSKQAIFDLLYSVCILIIVGILYITHTTSFKIYLSLVVVMNYLILIWYIANYMDIIKGPHEKIRDVKSDLLKLIRLGMPLMIANLAGEFILNMDRQVVNIFFTKEEYAVYAYAYNILSVANIFISAISLVLYPFLRKMDLENLKKNYSDANALILIVVYCCLTAYFPLVKVIEWLLSSYMDSIPILRIIFPIIVFTSSITVIKHNYYKALDKNHVYFYKSLFMLVLSLGANLAAYFIFGTMESISIASIITMMIWYIDTEIYFIKHYRVHFLKNFLYLIIMLAGYYLTVYLIPNIYLGCGIYILLVVLVSFICYKPLIVNVIKGVLTKQNKAKEAD